MSALSRFYLSVATIALLLTAARGAGPDRSRENPQGTDGLEPAYPLPYRLPATDEIMAAIGRIRDYLDAAVPTRVVDSKTGQEISDFSRPIETATVERGPAGFSPLAYEMGVVHSGMLRATAVTGDRRFAAFTQKQLDFLGRTLPYFRTVAERYGVDRNAFRTMLQPRALDDCGSMGAALLRARQAAVGPDLRVVIDTWSDYIAHKQFRLADGTLARQRPQAASLWADDFYMSIPALAEMGRLTGDRSWFDDAVKQVLQMSAREFNPALGIYTHGWNANNPEAPRFYWARANGWTVLAMCDLLDVLPKDHPGYGKVMAQLRAVLRGVSEYQSGTGLWHQMLDRNDSYLETSATAMFVYGIAHAVNEGWVSPTTYGSVAQAGWCGLATRINARGQVEGTCVGTTFASDQIYYYNRPTSVDALHGYGPTILAGAEMIRLLKNPNFTIEAKLRTYHYVPKGSETSYREHE
jgi:unsaturated rhamnogalacturonyl hydrolase